MRLQSPLCLVLAVAPVVIITAPASAQNVIFEDDFNFIVDSTAWPSNVFHGPGAFPNSSITFDPSLDENGPTGGTGTAQLFAATNPVGVAFGLAAIAGGGALEGQNQVSTGTAFDFQAEVLFTRTAFESGAFGAQSTPAQPGRPSGMFSISFFGADQEVRMFAGNMPGQNPGEVDWMVALGTRNLAFDNPEAIFFDIDGPDADADGTEALTLRDFGSVVDREITYRVTESVVDLLVDDVSVLGGPVAHGLPAEFFQDNLTDEFVNLNVGVESWHDTDSPAASEHWVDMVRLVENATGGVNGDYDDSGQVEQGDLDIVLQNWGTGTFTGNESNLVGGGPFDGTVDQNELDGVLQNWGSTSAPDFAGSAVPEPATLALMGGIGLLFARRARG